MFPLYQVDDEHALSCICEDGCQNRCMALEDFLDVRSVGAWAPCDTDLTGCIDLSGDNNNNVRRLRTTEAGKKLIRTLFKAIWCLERINRFFLNITMQNLFVSPSGHIRFHHVVLVEEGNSNIRDPAVRHNYQSALQIVRGLFRDQQNHPLPLNMLPADITHLFRLIQNDRMSEKKDLYHIHMSLVPIAVGMLAYTKMYDHLVTLGPNDEEVLLTTLYRNLDANWRHVACSNELLRAVYYYHNPSQYAGVTVRKIAEYAGIPEYDVPNMDPVYRQRLVNMLEVKLFLDFLRNRTAHRMEQWGRQGRGGQVMTYWPEGADNACLSRFGYFICRLQEELFYAEQMLDLNFEEFF